MRAIGPENNSKIRKNQLKEGNSSKFRKNMIFIIKSSVKYRERHRLNEKYKLIYIEYASAGSFDDFKLISIDSYVIKLNKKAKVKGKEDK